VVSLRYQSLPNYQNDLHFVRLAFQLQPARGGNLA